MAARAGGTRSVRRLVSACVFLAAAASAQIIFGRPRPAVPSTAPITPPPPPSDLGSACTTPEGRPGLCDRFVACPSLDKFRREKNIAYLRESVCGQHGTQRLLCCPDKVTPPAPPEPSCGFTTFVPPRIVGGEPVKAVGDLPWMAALTYKEEPVFKCGGAIVGKRWILTAAHCILKDGPISVRIGDLDLSTTKDNVFGPPQDIEVAEVFRHPDYSRGFRSPNKGLINDVALIKLNTDITFSELVTPICLPRKDQQFSSDARVLIAGWGLTSYKGVGSPLMQYAQVATRSVDRCQESYLRVGVRVDVGRHMCANGDDKDQVPPGCSPGSTEERCQGGVDACEGDSGGPLMMFERVPGGSRVHAIGLVSFAVGCGSAEFPGIYTRVDSYIDWIETTIAENSA